MFNIFSITMNQNLNELDKLIIEGINITRMAQEKNAIYSNNDNLLDDVFRKYNIWKIDIKNLLNQEKIVKKIDIGVFYEADAIPYFKGGIEYSNIKSEESQELLKNIRIETSKKLGYLREIKIKLENSKIEKKILKFIEKIVRNIIKSKFPWFPTL